MYIARIHIRLAVVAAAAVLLVPSASAGGFITDTLAPGGTPASGGHFITDTLAPGGGAGSVVSIPAGTAFNWADAGVGAAVGVGLMLLALTGHQLLLRRKRGQLAF